MKIEDIPDENFEPHFSDNEKPSNFAEIANKLASYFEWDFDSEQYTEITKALESAYSQGLDKSQEAFKSGQRMGIPFDERRQIMLPSEEIIMHKAIPEMDCYTLESQRGFFACYRWLSKNIKPVKKG